MSAVEKSADAVAKDSLGRIAHVLCIWQTNCAVSIHESCTSAFKLLFPVCSFIHPPRLLKAQVYPWCPYRSMLIGSLNTSRNLQANMAHSAFWSLFFDSESTHINVFYHAAARKAENQVVPSLSLKRVYSSVLWWYWSVIMHYTSTIDATFHLKCRQMNMFVTLLTLTLSAIAIHHSWLCIKFISILFFAVWELS